MRCGAKDLTRLEFSFKIPLFLWQTVEVGFKLSAIQRVACLVVIRIFMLNPPFE